MTNISTLTPEEIVEKAIAIIEYELKQCESMLATLKVFHELGTLKGDTNQTQRFLNSWRAHKDFFDRHTGKRYDGLLRCWTCWAEGEGEFTKYPCPELLTQATIILGGEE